MAMLGYLERAADTGIETNARNGVLLSVHRTSETIGEIDQMSLRSSFVAPVETWFDRYVKPNKSGG